jgi:hypothetical protein
MFANKVNAYGAYPLDLSEEAVDNDANDASCHVNLDESDDDDEDSNAESNWRNDYPDEDDDFDKRYSYYDQSYTVESDVDDDYFQAPNFDEQVKNDFAILKDFKKLKVQPITGTDDESEEWKNLDDHSND